MTATARTPQPKENEMNDADQRPAVVGQVEPSVRPLAFADAVRIARGCADYGGGYRGDPALFEAYQHGIMTVVAALTAAEERGLSDAQVHALHCMGAA